MPRTKATTATTAGLYGRTSTSNHGQDIGLQLDELRAFAKQRGWKALEFTDVGISGSQEDRPALNRLMTAARSGELGIVVCWKFDRFARSTRHLLQALEEFRSLGVQFVSLREQLDTTTPMGKAMFAIVAAIGELERELIKERVSAGVARAHAKGVKFGRPRRELDLRAARALLSQGHSMREVSGMLGLPRSTVRRRLAEEPETTGNSAGQKPSRTAKINPKKSCGPESMAESQ